MKKILGILAIFTIVGGLVFAQSVQVSGYNELYSKTVHQQIDDAEGAHLIFWGLRNRTGVKVDAGSWGADARYQLLLSSLNQTDYGDYAMVTLLNENKNWQANFWFKPISGITLYLGNDYGRQVAAGEVAAWDGRMGHMTLWNSGSHIKPNEDNVVKSVYDPSETMFSGKSSRYASNGITLEVTAIPNVKLAMNLPMNEIYWSEIRQFTLPFNLAADVNIANLFDVGVVYKGGFMQATREHSTIGAYVDFVGVKGLKIQAGWTGVVNPNDEVNSPNTKHLRDTCFSYAEYREPTRENLAPISQFASLFDIAFQFKADSGFMIAAAAELGAGYAYAFPLTVAAYVNVPNIVDTFGFDTRVTWESVSLANNGDIERVNAFNYGKVKISPNLSYKVGAHSFGIGANFGMGYTTWNYVDMEEGFPTGWFGFGFDIPVTWKVTF